MNKWNNYAISSMLAIFLGIMSMFFFAQAGEIRQLKEQLRIAESIIHCQEQAPHKYLRRHIRKGE